MGTSNVSNIGKVIVQTQMQNVKGSTQEENLQVAFSEVISQMQTDVGDGLMSEGRAMNVEADPVSLKIKADTDYERHGNCSVKMEQRSGVGKTEQEQVSEKLEQFAEDVKEVLKEELGVSEEQIAEAMEALGLSFSDLLNANQLALLVTELTGNKDMGMLLCSEEFTTIMNVVGELGEKLLRELGISGEELSQMLTDTQNMTEMVSSEQIPQTDSAVPEDNVPEIMAQENTVQVTMTQESDVSPQTVQDGKKNEVPLDALEVSEESLDEESKFVVDKNTTDDQKNASDERNAYENGEDLAESVASESNKNGMLHGQKTAENPGVQTRNDVMGSVNQNITENVFAPTQESVNGATTQVDVSDIIKQIVEFSRVTLSNTATTMEMQLNPENLGKIYLELTSKGGVVSAHITTQNEAVKEALESQLVEFKQNMNQAGVKVDAVEVAVGSHEFEKNLEQNAKQEQQQAEEQEKAAKQTRHINLNDLDELSGIMTEEESLVAQMMADQGNSVDFTA